MNIQFQKQCLLEWAASTPMYNDHEDQRQSTVNQWRSLPEEADDTTAALVTYLVGVLTKSALAKEKIDDIFATYTDEQRETFIKRFIEQLQKSTQQPTVSTSR